MKLASAEFVRGRPNARFLPALAGSPVPAALSAVALAFVELQQARHEADYDHLRVYTRPNARDIVQRTEQAFRLWRTVKGTPAADIYLVALLAQGNLRG